MQVWLFGARVFVVRGVKIRHICTEELVIFETIGLGIQSNFGRVDVVNGLSCGVFVADPSCHGVREEEACRRHHSPTHPSGQT